MGPEKKQVTDGTDCVWTEIKITTNFGRQILCLKPFTHSFIHYSLYSEWYLSALYGEEVKENEWVNSDADNESETCVADIIVSIS